MTCLTAVLGTQVPSQQLLEPSLKLLSGFPEKLQEKGCQGSLGVLDMQVPLPTQLSLGLAPQAIYSLHLNPLGAPQYLPLFSYKPSLLVPQGHGRLQRYTVGDLDPLLAASPAPAQCPDWNQSPGHFVPVEPSLLLVLLANRLCPAQL